MVIRFVMISLTKPKSAGNYAVISNLPLIPGKMQTHGLLFRQITGCTKDHHGGVFFELESAEHISPIPDDNPPFLPQ
jgi:hypothetical protein